MAKVIAMIVVISVAPRAALQLELLFNKPASGVVLTTLHFLRSLRMSAISKSVCPCNVTLLRRKQSVVNMVPGPQPMGSPFGTLLASNLVH